MNFKHIKSVGVEIESNWHKPRTDLIEDGSIRSDLFKNPKYYGELVSKPFTDYNELVDFIKNNWGDDTSERCGYHIHIGLSSIGLYSQLMSEKFYSYFLESIEKWAKENHITNPLFWKRLEGGMPKYCAKEYRADIQVALKSKNAARADNVRCTHLNYCFGQYKTLENRLAPTWICAETAISYTTAYLQCVESYLEESNLKEKPFKVQLIESEEIEDDDNVRVKPFELKLKPFNLFAPDFIYKKNKFQYENKERKLDEMEFNLSNEVWEELLRPNPYLEIF